MNNSESKTEQTNTDAENLTSNAILHISDLHFLENQSADRTNIQNELFLTLDNLPPEWKPNIVCITGDISDRNNVEGYSKAESWIMTLLERLEISPENLVMCPGNHDLDPEKAKSIVRPKDATALNSELTVPIPTKYKELFSLYRKMCGNIGVTLLDCNGDSSYLFGTKECAGVRFIISNSCWFCDPDNNEGMIDLPLLQHLESKYNFLQKKNNSSTKIIALVHHPEGGLGVLDTARYKNVPALGFLADRVDLILTGHLHTLPIGEGGYNSTPLLNCGATLQVDVDNTFALIRIEEGRFVYQFYRTDSTRTGSRWVKDDEPKKILCNISQEIVHGFYDKNGSVSSLADLLSDSPSGIQKPSGGSSENTTPIAPESLILDHDNIGININVLLDDVIKQLSKAERYIEKLEFVKAFDIVDQVKKSLEPLGTAIQSDDLSDIYRRISLIECVRADLLCQNKDVPVDYSVAKEYLERAKNARRK